jgi:ketosteroid isomerase-like protein
MTPSQSAESAEPRLNRDALLEIVSHYFAALDSQDVEGAVACFGPEASLTSGNDAASLVGHDALRNFFTEIFSVSLGMEHNVLSTVVDEDAGHVALEIRYRDRLKAGKSYDMRNANFFDIGADGLFERVHLWLGEAL